MSVLLQVDSRTVALASWDGTVALVTVEPDGSVQTVREYRIDDVLDGTRPALVRSA